MPYNYELGERSATSLYFDERSEDRRVLPAKYSGFFTSDRLFNVLSKLFSKWAKTLKEQSVRVYFDNMPLYFRCRINKTALLQTVFLVIFPTGLGVMM